MLTTLMNNIYNLAMSGMLFLILIFAIGLIVTSLTGNSGRYVSNVFAGLGRIFTALLRGLWNGFTSFLFFYGRTLRRSYLYMINHLPIRVRFLRWIAVMVIIAVVHIVIGIGLYQIWLVLI